MPKFFKPKQINEVMQLRTGAGYLILRTGDNEVTHCEVYCAGGMLRRVSDGKPVAMQFTDDEQVYFVPKVLARRAQERRRGAVATL